MTYPDYRHLTKKIKLTDKQRETVQKNVDNFFLNVHKITQGEERKRKLDDLDPKAAEHEKEKWEETVKAVETWKEYKQEKQAMTDIYDLFDTEDFSEDGRTLGSTQKAIKNLVSNENPDDMKGPWGPRKGKFNRRVKTIPPKDKAGFRTLEWLGWLSTAYHNQMSTFEVEAMLVNERFLVSANDWDSCKKVAQLVIADLMDKVAPPSDDEMDRVKKLSALASAIGLSPGDPTLPIDPNEQAKQEKGTRYLVEGAVDYHRDAESRESIGQFLSVLQQQMSDRLKAQGPLSPAKAADAIRDDKYKYTIIAVNPPGGDDSSHAEQHLVLALAKARYPGVAQVAGTKIPCATCWLTLATARACGYKIEFNNTPGGFWDTTTYHGFQAVIDELGNPDIDEVGEIFGELMTVLGDEKFWQWVTSLDTATGSKVQIVKAMKGMAKRLLTQDVSGGSQHEDYYTMSPIRDNSDDGTRPPTPTGAYGTQPDEL